MSSLLGLRSCVTTRSFKVLISSPVELSTTTCTNGLFDYLNVTATLLKGAGLCELWDLDSLQDFPVEDHPISRVVLLCSCQCIPGVVGLYSEPSRSMANSTIRVASRNFLTICLK